VCERGVARAGSVGRVGGERGEERERGGGAEAGVHDGGRHVGVPRAHVAPQRQRVRGEEEEQLRGQGGAGAVARPRAVRDEAGRVQLTRDGGHLHGDGGGGRGGEVGGGGGEDGVRAGGEEGQQREEIGGEEGEQSSSRARAVHPARRLVERRPAARGRPAAWRRDRDGLVSPWYMAGTTSSAARTRCHSAARQRRTTSSTSRRRGGRARTRTATDSASGAQTRPEQRLASLGSASATRLLETTTTGRVIDCSSATDLVPSLTMFFGCSTLLFYSRYIVVLLFLLQ
jgi:hypothetical protein